MYDEETGKYVLKIDGWKGTAVTIYALISMIYTTSAAFTYFFS